MPIPIHHFKRGFFTPFALHSNTALCVRRSLTLLARTAAPHIYTLCPYPLHTYLQLDAARKDSEAQRRRAAAVEGAAASAMAASPFPGGGGGNMMMMMRGGGVSGGGGGMSGGGGGGGTRRTTREEDDSMDAEVDDLLQQLQVCGQNKYGWYGVWGECARTQQGDAGEYKCHVYLCPALPPKQPPLTTSNYLQPPPQVAATSPVVSGKLHQRQQYNGDMAEGADDDVMRMHDSMGADGSVHVQRGAEGQEAPAMMAVLAPKTMVAKALSFPSPGR